MLDDTVFSCLERERIARNEPLLFREVGRKDVRGHGLNGSQQRRPHKATQD